MQYELTPVKKINIRATGREGINKMPSKKQQEVPTAKTRKVYETSRFEVAKTVLIAVLITAAIAFIAGVHYQDGRQDEIRQAVQAVQPAPASK